MNETSPELRKLQIEMTNLALKLAKIANVDLDFSIESVKQVEEILSQMHEQYKKNGDQEGVKGMALELAAYIITVIEKNIIKGQWERDSEEAGKETFPYHIAENNTIFPYGWALKRIIDGEGDNVWIKFKTLVLDKRN